MALADKFVEEFVNVVNETVSQSHGEQSIRLCCLWWLTDSSWVVPCLSVVSLGMEEPMKSTVRVEQEFV